MSNKLGDYLKSKRLEKNLSLRDFAKEIGISHTYLSKLESGVDPRSGKPISPTLDTILQISKTLNVTVEQLLAISGYVGDEEYLYVDLLIDVATNPEKVLLLKKSESLNNNEIEKVLSFIEGLIASKN